MAGWFVKKSILFLVVTLKLADCISDVCDTVQSYAAYSCQTHQVTTSDGYILSVQRIQKDGLFNSSQISQPVLLQHGIIVDGMAWVMNPPGEALAFLLADGGFDVWIANSRGTRFSREHLRFNADSDPEYWSWTWVELANYDLAANIEFIYKVTGQKLRYVGHSLGTLMMMALLSQHKLVDKLEGAAMLAPIAHLNRLTTPILLLGADFYAGEIVSLLGMPEFIPQSANVQALLQGICSNHGLNCSDMMAILTGNNCCLSPTAKQLFLEHEPQPTSTRNIVHLAQMVRTGRIALYDYENPLSNLVRYKQDPPPSYNLSNIPPDFPLLLSYRGNDAIADVRDIDYLLDELRDHHPEKLTVQRIDEYAHMDFLMGYNAGEKLKAPLVQFFLNK